MGQIGRKHPQKFLKEINAKLHRQQKNIKQKILLAQLQLKGIDIGQSSLSALEGQRREASDREALALSQIFQVPMERLIQPPEE